ncbi:heparinase II/III-like protein [Natranaerovirga hydrolytica]|uniref:Heparinase II/III-like protein n=1 Tax=Natranaerovirga hydrolytica TaxID=680378 RepID=A0A4R1MKX1_9FIRM|nr:heparinase II/III family protein [Natranaerovirga hydrolytica]TCK93135.1 heparinase II/III-like protein [Natranaerovirga hydrolytica]
MYKSLLTEYGIPWVINRSLYSVKLKMMRAMPITENLFEKKVEIKRIDIFQVDTNKIEVFLNDISDGDKKDIIQIADNAIEGKIKAFSSIELDYGSPINWHINPITKVEVDKNIKWYRIPDFDPVRGDIKAVWEASRFTHFFHFARAYMITKDTKYYNAFSIQISDWIKKNPYSYGPNYKCGQEATLRMINSLIAYSVFKDYGLTTKEDEIHLKKLIEGCYKKVISNFFYAHKCIKNNHTLSEITGMIIGAWCSNNKIALKRAYQLMDKEIENQFMNDGGYIQYSFNYQRFALQIMEFVLKISEITGVKLSDQSKVLIEKSVLQMYQLQDETSDVPNYGSNDGALIFPVTTCNYRDFRPVLNTVHTVLKGKRLYDQGNYDEELLWFSDKNIRNIPYAGIQRKSVSYGDSGFYSLRHNDGHLMIVLQDFKTRPAQMDQMHIDLWHKGVNVLCDSGTYSYATDLGKQLALTAAHNTVKIGDKEQMKKHGPFLIYDWTSATDVEFNDNHFEGTMKSKNGYSHTRVINKDSVGYSIEDHVVRDVENYSVLFQTPCEIEKKEHGLDLFFDNKLIAKIMTEDEIHIEKSYRSLYYLKKDAVNQITIISEINKVNRMHIKLMK